MFYRLTFLNSTKYELKLPCKKKKTICFSMQHERAPQISPGLGDVQSLYITLETTILLDAGSLNS